MISTRILSDLSPANIDFIRDKKQEHANLTQQIKTVRNSLRSQEKNILDLRGSSRLIDNLAVSFRIIFDGRFPAWLARLPLDTQRVSAIYGFYRDQKTDEQHFLKLQEQRYVVDKGLREDINRFLLIAPGNNPAKDLHRLGQIEYILSGHLLIVDELTWARSNDVSAVLEKLKNNREAVMKEIDRLHDTFPEQAHEQKQKIRELKSLIRYSLLDPELPLFSSALTHYTESLNQILFELRTFERTLKRLTNRLITNILNAVELPE